MTTQHDEYKRAFGDALDRALLLSEMLGEAEARRLYYTGDWWDRLLHFQIEVVEKISWETFRIAYYVGKVCDHVKQVGHEINRRHARWLMETLGPYDPWWRQVLRELGEKMTTYPIIEDFDEIMEGYDDAAE